MKGINLENENESKKYTKYNPQLSFVKIGRFSLNLWNELKDSFLSVYFLFELINFKNV
jgi:hypothetical protein